jgi:hypothetical protein
MNQHSSRISLNVTALIQVLMVLLFEHEDLDPTRPHYEVLLPVYFLQIQSPEHLLYNHALLERDLSWLGSVR